MMSLVNQTSVQSRKRFKSIKIENPEILSLIRANLNGFLNQSYIGCDKVSLYLTTRDAFWLSRIF